MRWITFNGMYPTNPAWTNILVVLIFELAVIGIEFIIISSYLEKIKSKKGVLAIVITANIVTFLIGALIQSMYIFN